MVFAFDDSHGVTLARAKDLGRALKKHVQSGDVNGQQVDRAELSEAFHRLLKVRERGESRSCGGSEPRATQRNASKSAGLATP